MKLIYLNIVPISRRAEEAAVESETQSESAFLLVRREIVAADNMPKVGGEFKVNVQIYNAGNRYVKSPRRWI